MCIEVALPGTAQCAAIVCKVLSLVFHAGLMQLLVAAYISSAGPTESPTS